MKDEPDMESTCGKGQNLAPRRPPKRLSSHSQQQENKDDALFPSASKDAVFLDDDDSFGIPKDSPQKEVRCFVCNKDITHLNSTRREIHSNGCLDQQQSTESYQKAKEKHANTTDCPICSEPLGPGPHRAAHLKSCGKKHNVSGSGLIEMFKVQSKVTEIKKKQNRPHTKAPSPVFKKIQPPKLKNMPQSVFDEELQVAKALSESLESVHPLPLKEATPKFTRLPDPSENRRKRPRSYAIVEFEPRTCKCQVFSSIHARFLDAFRVAGSPSIKEECDQSARQLFLHSTAQRRLITKMNRFTKLSQDFSHLLNNKQFSDMSISCNDGVIDVHRCVLHSRTSLPLTENCFRLGYSREIVNCWLNFVYCGDISWGLEHAEAITELSEKYGPEDLPSVFKLLGKSEEQDESDHKDSVLCCQCGLTTSATHRDEKPSSTGTDCSHAEKHIDNKENFIVPKESRSSQLALDFNYSMPCDRRTITLSSEQKSNDSMWDCEDPLQGIKLNSISDECGVRAVSPTSDTIFSNDNDELNQAITCDDDFKQTSSFSAYETPIASEHRDVFEDGAIVADQPIEISVCDPVDFYDPVDNYDDFGINEHFDDFNHFSSPAATVAHESINNDNDIIVLSDSPDPPPPKTLSSSYMSTDRGRELSPITDFTMSPMRFSSTGLSPTPTEDCATEPRMSLPRSTLSSSDFENDLKPSSSSESRGNGIQLGENDVYDSFNDSVVFNPASPPCSTSSYTNVASLPLAQSTPIQPAIKRLKFGSHVKVLKTNAVTPMLDYEGMSDDILKAEIAKIGLRPMTRKKAIETLKTIYNETHPAIDPSTPTLRPIAREPRARKVPAKTKAPPKAAKTKESLVKPGPSTVLAKTPEKKSTPFSPLGSPISDTEELGNKTLNESFEEPLEETMMQNADAMPSNGDSMKEKLVNWLSKPENFELSNHVVTLNSVDIEELYLRMMRSDDPVCEIPKKTLPTLLDSMGISFSVPVPPGGRKGMSAGNGRMRRK